MTSHIGRVLRTLAREEARCVESRARSNQLLATLHDEHGLSWPEIARLTGIAQSTAYRRAAEAR